MINEALVSLTGYVATQPRWRETSSGTPNITMRVAWTPRRMDRSTGEWADGHTSYVTVICWRKLADNVATCLRKGDPVVVKGRLTVRPYDKDGVPRTAVEVDASSVGHDLSRGVAQFQRTRPPTGKTADEYTAGLQAGGDDDTGAMAALGEVGLGEAALSEAGLAAAAGEPPGREMFDEQAISALAREAQEADAVAAPF